MATKLQRFEAALNDWASDEPARIHKCMDALHLQWPRLSIWLNSAGTRMRIATVGEGESSVALDLNAYRRRDRDPRLVKQAVAILDLLNRSITKA